MYCFCWPTVVKGDSKGPFSIATAPDVPRFRVERYLYIYIYIYIYIDSQENM